MKTKGQLINEYHQLLEQNVITPEEYEEIKKNILEGKYKQEEKSCNDSDRDSAKTGTKNGANTGTKIGMGGICAIVLALGILLFFIGTGIDSGTELRSYDKIYKDEASGYYQSRTHYYLAEKTNGFETIGLILAIGGIGMIRICAKKKNK